MTKDEILQLRGEFTWNFSQEFYIKTAKGNFIWSDPDYQGTNELRKTNKTYKEWLKGIPYGRCKGTHTIAGYCGKDVKIIDGDRR